MKKILILSILMMLISSCDIPKREYVETTTWKTIKAKDTPIENKFSGGDYFFGNGSVTKSQTVYYLYFTDGSSKAVTREKFFKYNIGDKIGLTSGYYKNIE